MKAAAPERRCIITGETGPRTGLVRMVLDPEGLLVPDVAAKLPGRGIWVTADRALIEAAIHDGRLAKGASRSLKARVTSAAIPSDLADQIEALLLRRTKDRLGLLKRSNNLVIGQDMIRAALKEAPARPAKLVLTASDAAEGSVQKMRTIAQERCEIIQPFDRATLSQALGGENMVHVLVWDEGGTEELTTDLSRLEGVRRDAE